MQKTDQRVDGHRPAGAETRPERRWLGRLIREPFVHFILLGAAIVAAHQVIEQRARLTRILVTQDQVRHLADNYRMQYGSTPTPQQLESLVDKLIKSEIFTREAFKLGLDADDEIIRRRLVQKYEFLQEDLAIPAEPTDAQLLNYYRQHPNRYLRSATASFTHVYFSPDARGEEGARAAASALAAQMNRTGAVRAVEQGDRFPGPYDFSALSGEEAARVFGQGGLSEAIFEVAAGDWSAPLRSGFGWHTVYVSSRQPALPEEFSQVREPVKQDYLDAERKTRNEQMLAKLYRNYRIVRE